MKRLLNKRFLLRELVHGRRHGLLFILCVALSLTTMTALNGFKGGVNRSLFEDARELHGGDIILHSHYPFSPALRSEVDKLVEEKRVAAVKTHRFYSVVMGAGGDATDATLLSEIKIVDEGFPLYGRVELASGEPLRTVLKSGTTVVAEDVLKRLDLQVGDFLKVGKEELRIADTVLYESDSPVNILNFGPRVFVSDADLEAVDLVRTGSRVHYEVLLRVAQESDLAEIYSQLQSKVLVGQERVETFRDAGSRVKRFFDNLLFFLSLISIFTLLLAGLGMQSCLTALVRQKEKTIAVTRTVGATSGFLYRHYLVLVLLQGLAGAVLGVGLGVVIGLYLPTLFEGLLPVQGETAISFTDLGEGLLLGFVVVLLFTFLPLYRLRNIKPVAIFRSDKNASGRDMVFYLVVAAGIALITLLVIRQLEDRFTGLMFMGGILVLITAIAVAAHLLMKSATALKIRALSMRQALRSMTRAGNATRSIIVTLASALTLLFAIYLVEHNLQSAYVESYPEDAPNLFCIDIQPDQREGFSAFFEEEPELFPIIRARLIAINGEQIRREEELKKKSDNFAREFNLTYREYLLEDEVLSRGEELFTSNKDGGVDLQVSILDTVTEMGDIGLGDILLFNIQGVELEARVTSVRSRTKSMLYPFFYFVFPGEYLKEAPQTFFSAVQVDQEEIAGLQRRILRQYPNISFINVSKAAEDIGVLMEKLTAIVNFFASFSLLAGGLILVSSILATRLARTREAVYYKILGGKKGFVYTVFIWENGLIGLFSAAVALVLAHCGSWALCHYLFDIPYDPDFVASVLLALMTVVVVILTGFLSSLNIVGQKPARFLWENGNG
ncbi:MAG: FtsX-like permease family protein [Desulfopila sp.]|jgi:putative ABC transport system permease protein|nr:FtsX-like permease family protein [Desulfopila sp.]